jgi:hypothetical protein
VGVAHVIPFATYNNPFNLNNFVVETIDFVHNIWKKNLPNNFMPHSVKENVVLVLNILFTKKSIIVDKEEMAHLLKEENHVMQWV